MVRQAYKSQQVYTKPARAEAQGEKEAMKNIWPTSARHAKSTLNKATFNTKQIIWKVSNQCGTSRGCGQTGQIP